MGEVKKVGDDNWDEIVLGNPGRVLAVFMASWSNPCKALMPLLDELAQSRPDITVVTIDVGGRNDDGGDDNPITRDRYGVRGLPRIMAFDGGVPFAETLGVSTTERFFKWIDEKFGATPFASAASRTAAAPQPLPA